MYFWILQSSEKVKKLWKSQYHRKSSSAQIQPCPRRPIPIWRFRFKLTCGLGRRVQSDAERCALSFSSEFQICWAGIVQLEHECLSFWDFNRKNVILLNCSNLWIYNDASIIHCITIIHARLLRPKYILWRRLLDFVCLLVHFCHFNFLLGQFIGLLLE